MLDEVDGPCLRRRLERSLRAGQVGLLVLHGLLLHGRLRAGRVVDRAASASAASSTPARPGPVPERPLRQRAGHPAVPPRPLERGRGRARAHPRPHRSRSCRARPATRRSRWPSCASCRAGSTRPRRCCSAGTTSIQALLPTARLHLARGDLDLACAAARRGPAADGGRPGAGCRSCSASWWRPSSGGATSTPPPTRRPSSTHASAGLGLPALAAEAARVRALGASPRRATRPPRRRRCRMASTRWPAPTCPTCAWCSTSTLARLLRGRPTGPRPSIEARAAADAAGAARRGGRHGRRRPARPAVRRPAARARAPRRPRRDARAGRRLVDGRVRRHQGPPPRHQGPALPGRARRPSRRRAPRPRPRRPRRGRGDRRASTGAARRCRRAARRLGPGGLPPPDRGRCATRSRTPSPPRTTTGPRSSRPSSTRWSPSWPGRSGSAAGTGRASSAAERARLNVTRALRAALARLIEALPGGGRRARPADPHRDVLRLRAARRRRRSLECSVLTERDGRPTERLQGMETNLRRDRRRHLPHLAPSCPRSRRRPASPSTSS